MLCTKYIVVFSLESSFPVVLSGGVYNLFWGSRPELFSGIACLRVPCQSCVVLFGNFFSGAPASKRRELRLHLNVVPAGAGVFKGRRVLLHRYVHL